MGITAPVDALLPVVGLHDAFVSTLDLPRVATPQAAVEWAMEQARQREV